MTDRRQCLDCGAELDAQALSGLCPRCLLKLIELSQADAADPAAEEAACVDHAGGDILGRYRLFEKIGEGGFGAVWKAEQMAPVQRLVALKLIKLGMDTREVIARFQAESQALALMDHPGIAKVLDAGSSPGGRPFFVMELVEGVPITRYCKEQGLSLKARLHLFLDVCAAVQHAHQKGIIHRDLKPSNILVGRPKESAGDPVAKVIDFGIAKAIEGGLTDHTMMTREGQFVGTPVYMSPEQAGAQGVDVDTRSDIYTLGVVLYELLAGVPPFDARSLLSAGYEEMCRIIREADPPKPSTRLQSTLQASPTSPSGPSNYRALRGDLDWIVMKALEKERARRYETVDGFSLDIESYLKDEPVVAAAPRFLYKSGKFMRRNRAAAAVAAVIMALLAGGIAGTLSFAFREKAQRKAAQVNAIEARKSDARTREASRRLQVQQAEHFMQAGEVGTGLAYLSRVIRDEPNDAGAAGRIIDVLVRGDHHWLAFEPVRDKSRRITSAGFSPDGLRFVAVGSNKFSVGSAETGLATGGSVPGDTVHYAEFSPDGSRIVTASSDGTGRLWDAETRQPIGEPMRHESEVYTAKFCPDGSRILTACMDRSARLWDADTCRPVGGPMRHDWVRSPQFSGNGLRLSTDHITAVVRDVVTNEPVGAALTHQAQIRSAQFSPDGSLVVTASYDKTAQVWDALTGRPVGEPLHHAESIGYAEFSPDGLRVVTASEDKTARVWDAQTGAPVTDPLSCEGNVAFARFSPDGRRVLALSRSNQILRVWETETGGPLGSPIEPAGGISFDLSYLRLGGAIPFGQSYPSSPAFNGDGSRVIVVTHQGSVQVWDVESSRLVGEPMQHVDNVRYVRSAYFSEDGQQIITVSDINSATLRTAGELGQIRRWDARTGELVDGPRDYGHPWMVAEFSQDGRKVATASADGKARMWDGLTGQPLGEPMRHEDAIRSAEFSSDGSRLVTATWGTTAHLWDAETGQPLGEPMRHEGFVVSARFDPEGRRVVTASSEEEARLWDGHSANPLGMSLRHEDHVTSARFSADGLRIVTASWDGSARVWDARTGRIIGEPLLHGERVTDAQFSPDGWKVLTTSTNRVSGYSQGTVMDSLRVFEVRSAEEPGEWMRRADDEPVTVELSPDGLRVATVSEAGVVKLFDVNSGSAAGEPMPHEDRVNSCRFSPDGSRLVTASRDKTVRQWDARRGQPFGDPILHGREVDSAQFSPDGALIVSVAVNRAQIWDARTGRPLGDPMLDSHRLMSARFSADGTLLVTASTGKTVQLWEAPTGRPVGEPLPHEEAVRFADFNPDASRVLSVLWGNSALIWNVRTRKQVGAPLRHDAPIISAEFSPDGRRILTGSLDGTARLWDADSGRALGEPMRHTASLTACRFNEDASCVLTASEDRTARLWDGYTGKPLGKPWRHDSPVNAAWFSRDNLSVVTSSGGGVRRWAIAPIPVPNWIADWAESIAGQRLTALGFMELVSETEVLHLKQNVLSSSDTDFYTQAAKWFFADPDQRASSPWAESR